MKMVYVLVAAVAAAAFAGGARSLVESRPAPSAVPTAVPTEIAADSPHPRATQQPAEVEPVARAKGGKTVAEIVADRTKLAGKKVRLHATVVKSTPGVLGKTWLHLRDGSGAEGSNDLAATTQATPEVGETITVECTVALDRDVGAGYRFPTLLEDCTVE